MIWKVIWAIVFVMLVAGFVFAQPPCYTCKPAAVRAYVPPVRKVYQPTTFYRDRTILFADAAFYVFDPEIKDAFIFTGPPPKIAPGLTLGIAVNGAELRGTLPPQGQGEAVQGQGRVALAEAAYQGGSIVGYENKEANAPAGSPSSALITDLTKSCAGCHTAGKAKGEFVLFSGPGTIAPGVDWNRVYSAVTPAGPNKAPRMPLGNKTVLLPNSLKEIALQRSKR